MATVDVFGGMSKKSESISRVLSSSGLKTTGGVMTGDISMGNNKITELNEDYPPHNSQAVSWSQSIKLGEEMGMQYWQLNGNTTNQNTKIGSLDNFNVEFIRNNQECLTLRQQRIMVKKDLDMSNCKIYNLADPGHAQSAVNKRYVDDKMSRVENQNPSRIRNTSGFIPSLYSNESKSGFIVTTSNSAPGWMVFSNTASEWQSNDDNMNAWLQIKLPFSIAIWAFSLRGGSERWYDWSIEASINTSAWKTLITATNDYLGDTTKFYKFPVLESGEYLYYRFVGIKGEPSSPRLSYWQIYSIDECI